MINSLITFLKGKGLPFETPDNTLVKFAYEGLNYLFQYREEDDPQFIRMLLPGVEDVNDNESEVCKRMIEVSSSIKGVKSIITNNEVWLSVEQFMTSKENIAPVFERMISALKLAYTNYASAAVKKSQYQSDEAANA